MPADAQAVGQALDRCAEQEDLADIAQELATHRADSDARFNALQSLTADGMRAALVDLIYPVGSVYMSAGEVSPAVLFGGTWSQVTGRFILAASEAVPVRSTGGTETHAHLIDGTALTAGQMPKHNHGEKVLIGGFTITGLSRWSDNKGKAYSTVALTKENKICKLLASKTAQQYASSKAATNSTGKDSIQITATHTHASNGNGEAHTHTAQESNHVPPYMAVNVWIREE